MKKLLPLLLVLLLLAGCGDQTPDETAANAEQTESVKKGLYVPNSAVETETDGAVRVYRLERNDYFAVSSMGNRLLLRAEDGTVTALQGEECVSAASLSTDCAIETLSVCFDSAVQGAAYYSRETRQVVLVNPQLQETDRLDLPENMQGNPYISLTQGEIYYCVPGEIRALSIQTGISRLIRSHSYPYQQLMGMYFDGTVLQCEFFREEMADGPTEYISTETGKTLYNGDSHLYPFHTYEDSYLLSRMDGGVSQTIVGTREGAAQAAFITEDRYASALSMGGMLGYTAGGNTDLAYYDLESGKCTARVTLPGISQPKSFLATQDAVWILAYEGEQQVLCRWNITQSSVNDNTVYTGQLFTAENPDTEGLEACRERAEQMSEQYGVKIHLWQDVIRNQSSDSTVVEEYQVETIHRMLDELALALEQFPGDFLRKTVEAGWIHVNLVRSVGGDATYEQYWQDGDCYISVTNKYNVTEEFYQGVAYAIDSHVLGNSRKFDDWDDLNPEGFFYSYSYGTRPDLDTFLYCEDSAFISEQAMAYPHDDRAAVFFHAVTGSGESTFQSEVMQAKLERLCQGIREAYGLEESPDTYLWEQYLTESLAYTE